MPWVAVVIEMEGTLPCAFPDLSPRQNADTKYSPPNFPIQSKSPHQFSHIAHSWHQFPTARIVFPHNQVVKKIVSAISALLSRLIEATAEGRQWFKVGVQSLQGT